MLKQLPNALTVSRLILAPVVAWAVWQSYAAEDAARWAVWAFALFAVAALTDLFDGMIARALDAHSKFGRLVDPIADKALVGLPLVALSLIAWRAGWGVWPLIALASAVIIGRDLLITAIRMSSPDGEGVRVSRLAKWKTALELVAVGAPLLLIASQGAGSDMLVAACAGLLALAAALSAYTGLQYLRR
jgi:cardiolipin synthase